jgi:positive regulator of sigma E activity
MKKTLGEGWKSFLKLCRFLTWYGIIVAAIFYLLPIVGLIAETHYETLSGIAKFTSVLGFFLVVVTWQVLSTRDRWRQRA